MMVYDIIENISNDPDNNVIVLTLKLTEEFEHKKITFLSHTKKDIIRNIKFKNVIEAVKSFFIFKQPFSERVKTAVYHLNIGYIEKVIKLQKPDIIHIHGITKDAISQFNTCLKTGVPFIVTLHGLIGLSDTIKIPDFYKKLEYKLLKKAAQNNVPVTVISQGMINRISEKYNLSTDNIHLISNGVKINKVDKTNTIDIKKEYNINDSKKIILCIGSVTENKNQLQIVDAVELLPDEIKNKFLILIIGSDMLDGALEKRISEKKLDDYIKYAGFIEKNMIWNYYEQGDYVLLASKNEGFGLSIAEGFFHGLPTITFSDLDAIPDLYNEKVMMLAYDRTTESLTNAINQAISKNWDKEYIKQYACKFSYNNMIRKYQQLYDLLVNK
jgi:glycosyltransferase involved in cell wall biosynthesis